MQISFTDFSIEEVTLQLEDPLFVEYFNIFLSLPVDINIQFLISKLIFYNPRQYSKII